MKYKLQIWQFEAWNDHPNGEYESLTDLLTELQEQVFIGFSMGRAQIVEIGERVLTPEDFKRLLPKDWGDNSGDSQNGSEADGNLFFEIQPDGLQRKVFTPSRNDEDGKGVTIYFSYRREAAVIIERANNKILLHYWDGIRNVAVSGDEPETIVIADNYDEWLAKMKEKHGT